MAYMYIEKNIKKGVVTIRDSVSYKSLDDELIAKEDWESNKLQIISNLDNNLLSTDIEKILSNFESLLDGRYTEINQNISSGVNNKIKIKYNKQNEVLHYTGNYHIKKWMTA